MTEPRCLMEPNRAYLRFRPASLVRENGFVGWPPIGDPARLRGCRRSTQPNGVLGMVGEKPVPMDCPQ
jgi:hypothetical protein